jgi:serine protease
MGMVVAAAALISPAVQAQQALAKGVAVTGLSAAVNTTRDFMLVVPAGATQLSFTLSGGSGDADLYVRRGALATSSSRDCASEGSTNAESCSFASPTAATYYVRVQAYRAYSGVSLVANYNGGAAPTVTLQNGATVSNLGAAAGAWLRYRIDVPAGATNLVVRTSGGTGAVDLYVRAAAEPSSSVYDCRPLVVGNSETCSFAQPQTASYYIGLYGFNAFAGVTLSASYSLPPPPPPGTGATWPGFNTYYVNAIGKTGVALRSALNEAAGRSHLRMSYSAVWEALKYTDEDPANTANVILIYTGRSQAKTRNASGNSSDQDAWNREHVWPKSHGFPDEGQWAHTDIHHLRPADVSVNSTRGNKDFDWGGSSIGEAPGNLTDADSFEPRAAVKGDIARMMFYLAIRYEGSDITGVGNLELADNVGTSGNLMGKRCALVSWHRQDPVSNDEIRRHGRIVERQGNRNPFVDYPSWVEELFGAGCP